MFKIYIASDDVARSLRNTYKEGKLERVVNWMECNVRAMFSSATDKLSKIPITYDKMMTRRSISSILKHIS